MPGSKLYHPWRDLLRLVPGVKPWVKTALLYKRAVGCNVWHGARAMIGEPVKNESVGEAVGVLCTSATCTVEP